MTVPTWAETCWSGFYKCNWFLTIQRFYITECISWIIKHLVSLMHGVAMKIIVTKRCSDYSSGFWSTHLYYGSFLLPEIRYWPLTVKLSSSKWRQLAAKQLFIALSNRKTRAAQWISLILFGSWPNKVVWGRSRKRPEISRPVESTLNGAFKSTERTVSTTFRLNCKLG